MSVHRKNNRWVVRWRDEGRQRSRSFPTKREAVEFERLRQRDEWRDGIAQPHGAIGLDAATTRTTLIVAENFCGEDSDLPTRQRQLHTGFFPTIPLADAYRQQMPDADALSIVLLYNRFPVRDLTEQEIALRELQESASDLDLKRGIANETGRESRS